MTPPDAKKPDPRKTLGRGLSALLGEAAAEAIAPSSPGRPAGAKLIPVGAIRPGNFQPRRVFKEDEMDELVSSIREHGVLQPILLRKDPRDPQGFELIAGERRWRASQKAGIHEIPAVVRELNDTQALQAALVENLQRQDLSPIEEARAFKRLIDEFRHTQEKIGEALGKSRSYIANAVRLLELPDDIIEMIERDALTPGHARLLVGRADASLIAADWVRRKLTVREAEAAMAAIRAPKQKLTPKGGKKPADDILRDANTTDLERRLTMALGCKVEILHNPKVNTGVFKVTYNTLDQLDDIIERVSGAGTDGEWKKPQNWSVGMDKRK